MTIDTMAKPADLNVAKGRQQAAWSSGDYAVIGTTLQIVGEVLCEAVDLRSTDRVLDVAAGNGNASLAAARRFATVVSTDYVGSLLDRGRTRAVADGLDIAFQQADAESLPFDDASFDVVLSTFGVMFTPDQKRAADELVRVCRSGGRIGLANWTPESFVGQMFKLMGTIIPPPEGVKSPALWGVADHVTQLLGSKVDVSANERYFNFRYRSPKHMVDTFRTYYGPVLKAFAAVGSEREEDLERNLLALIGKFNSAKDGTVVLPGAYLEVVATRR